MKKFILLTCLVLAAVGFTACHSDNNRGNLYSTIVGRVWAGDLGFYQNGQYPLDSYVYFGADGFGTDELHYADNGEYLDRLNIQWDWNNNGTIYISYGNVDSPRELREVYIRNGRLSAELYIAGRYYDHIYLYMQ